MKVPGQVALALVAALAIAAPASAAAPSARTGGTSEVTAGGATLSGSVNPGRQPTTYHFEYGTTRRYGSRTPDVSAGRGSSARRATAVLAGLQPNTRYHYRLVASNPSGVRSGENRSFRTRREPLALALFANPNPVRFGDRSSIVGRLTGTGNASREVVLQQRVFPYTGPWVDVGAPTVTDPAGDFGFFALLPPQTAQFRARTVRGNVTSPVVTLGVAVRIKTNVSATRVRRGRLVRFSGVIRPARPGAQFAVQKQTSTGNWVTVAGGITRTGGDTYSGFTRRVRVRRGGNYRVFVHIVDGNLTSNVGRTVRIRTR